MKHVRDGLSLKNIRDRLRRSMQSIFESKSLTKEQISQYIKTKNEINKSLKDKKIKYVRNDIAEKVIKNCRCVKKKVMIMQIDKTKKIKDKILENY